MREPRALSTRMNVFMGKKAVRDGIYGLNMSTSSTSVRCLTQDTVEKRHNAGDVLAWQGRPQAPNVLRPPTRGALLAAHCSSICET